jgi:hypothetical protein
MNDPMIIYSKGNLVQAHKIGFQPVYGVLIEENKVAYVTDEEYPKSGIMVVDDKVTLSPLRKGEVNSFSTTQRTAFGLLLEVLGEESPF